jgi:RNA polymerase sigma factor (sigma-70 family)
MKTKSKRTRKPTTLEITLLFKELENQDKSGEAFHELFYKLSCIPQRLVRKYHWAPNQRDLLNSGYETLIRAIRTYDFAKCNNFFLWGERWIRKEIAKEKFKEKEWVDNQHLSQDVAEYADLLPDPVNLEDDYQVAEERALAYQLINSLEPTSMNFIQKLYGLEDNDPVSLRALAKELKISPKKAWKLKSEIIETLHDTYQELNKPHANNQH